jgi:ribonuclease I
MVGDRQMNGEYFLMVNIEEYSQIWFIAPWWIKKATCSGDETQGYFGQAIGCQRHYLQRKKKLHCTKVSGSYLSVQDRLRAYKIQL